MKKAIVTGYEGQDGYYLAKSLKTDGYNVLGLSRNASFADGQKHAPIPLNDPKAVDRVVSDFQPDYVYHLAAYHHSSESAPEPLAVTFSKSFDIHVNAVNNFLGAMSRHAEKGRFFFASSSRIFGNPIEVPQNEATRLNPLCPYGVSKVAGMGLCRLYRERNGMFASCGILYNHDSPRRQAHYLLPRLVKDSLLIKEGKEKSLCVGDAGATIDLGYAPEYVEAIRQIMALPKAEDFIIATGRNYSVREIINATFQALNLDPLPPITIDPGRLTSRPVLNPLIGDGSKLLKATGWRATVELTEIIASILEGQAPNDD